MVEVIIVSVVGSVSCAILYGCGLRTLHWTLAAETIHVTV